MIISDKIKPFLKWAGGKQWLSHRLIKIIPENRYTFYEPFLGGGSLFFAARPKLAILGDTNARLIETYIMVRDCPHDVIQILSEWPNEKEVYYQVRSKEYSDKSQRAAQFIYLNKSCWNGLYRVNQEGKFNVPFGNNKRDIYNEKHILQASNILKNTTLVCYDFQEVVETAKTGDFVYLDPPYTVIHSKNGFRRYNEKLFSWNDQVRLANAARDLAKRGCHVVVSNADNEKVLELYPDFIHLRLVRHSTIAANALRRRQTQESLFLFLQDVTFDEVRSKISGAGLHF
jgi:DNA adenine methylase